MFFRNLKNRWHGSAEERKSFASESQSEVQAYQALEIKVNNKELKKLALFGEVKQIVQEKKRLIDNPPVIERYRKCIYKYIFSATLITELLNLIYQSPLAYHYAQNLISKHINDITKPYWASLSEDCLLQFEQDTGITAPEQCYHLVPPIWLLYTQHPLDVSRYRDECKKDIYWLNWHCNDYFGTPCLMLEYDISYLGLLWKPALEIVAIFLLGLLFIKYQKHHYKQKIKFNSNELLKISNFLILEKNIDAFNISLQNISTSYVIHLVNLIEWSYVEISKYQQYVLDVKSYLIDKNIITQDTVTLIMDYLDDVKYIEQPALQLDNTVEIVNNHWKKTFANFFRSVTGEDKMGSTTTQNKADERKMSSNTIGLQK